MIFGTKTKASPKRTNAPTRPKSEFPLPTRSVTVKGNEIPAKSIALLGGVKLNHPF